MEEEKFNEMQRIKRRFFAMRNGVVADALRKGGSPFRMIFGLNLPQLREIATEIGENAALADRLRRDLGTRESQILAALITPRTDLKSESLQAILSDITDTETADMYCRFVIAGQPGEKEFIERLSVDENAMFRYMALRLLMPYAESDPDFALKTARREIEKNNRLTYASAVMIADSAEYWKEASED